jgi:hypothetical protein
MGGRDQQGSDFALMVVRKVLGDGPRTDGSVSFARSNIFPHPHVKSLSDCRKTTGVLSG